MEGTRRKFEKQIHSLTRENDIIYHQLIDRDNVISKLTNQISLLKVTVSNLQTTIQMLIITEIVELTTPPHGSEKDSSWLKGMIEKYTRELTAVKAVNEKLLSALGTDDVTASFILTTFTASKLLEKQ